MKQNILLTTASALEGYCIVEQCGIVFGETVFKNSLKSSLSAGLSNMVDSLRFKETEMSGSVSLIENAREYAYQKMIHQAEMRGANAIIAIDSDNTIGGDNIMYISLFGTAVKVITNEEKAEYDRKKNENKIRAEREAEERRTIKEELETGNAPAVKDFLSEIEGCTSMQDIWGKWVDSPYTKYYPEVGAAIEKYRDIERMYGKSGFGNQLKKLTDLLSKF